MSQLNPTSVSVTTKTSGSSSETEQQTKISTTEDSFQEILSIVEAIMPDNILYWSTKDFKSGSKSNKLGFKIDGHSSTGSQLIQYPPSGQDQRKLCQSELLQRFYLSDLGAFSL